MAQERGSASIDTHQLRYNWFSSMTYLLNCVIVLKKKFLLNFRLVKIKECLATRLNKCSHLIDGLVLNKNVNLQKPSGLHLATSVIDNPKCNFY